MAVDASPLSQSDAAASQSFRSWRRAGAVYAVLLGVLALAMSDALVTMARTGWGVVTYNHIFLVPLVSLYLIWQRRTALAAIVPVPAPIGLLGLLGCMMLWLVSTAAEVVMGQQLAFVGAAITLFIALFGWRAARLIWFPLAFLLFAVPMGDNFVPALQDITAVFSVWLLRLTGIPTFHEGTLILLPNGAFEVAEACAGLRFIIANVAIAGLFCYLAFHRVWKWLVFMALAVLIPVIANGLRAYGIMVVAYLTDNEYAAGVDHLVYGWGFFTLVMLLLILAGTLFADRRPSLPEDPSIASAEPANMPGKSQRMAVLSLAAAIILVPAGYAQAMQLPALDRPATLPALPERMSAQAVSEGAWRPTVRGASDSHLATIGQGVTLFLAHYPQQRQGAEAIQHGNRWFADPWARTGVMRLSVADGVPSEAMPRLDLRGLKIAAGGTRRLVAYGYWVDRTLHADPVRLKLDQALGRLMLDEPSVTLVALSVSYDHGPEEAITRIEAALANIGGLRPYLETIGREE